ncbi:MAG: flagellar filament capping protein FliD, partial [Planctomycetaceae bacterium]
SGLTTDATTALGLAGEIQLRAGGFIDNSVSLDDLNQGRGVERDSIRITDRAGNTEEIDLSQATTIDDVLAAINDASVARVRATTVGDSIRLTDLSGSVAGNLRVDEVGGGETAADLGLRGVDVAASTATGSDIYGAVTDTAPTGLQGVPLSKLGGGSGLGTLTSINITTTDGVTAAVDLSSATTTQDLVTLINDSGLDVEAKLNDSATGLRIRDLSGGSANAFSISSNDGTAAALGIAKTSNSRVIDGNDLQKQFIDSTTKLSALRQGRGVDDGTILLTDSTGATASVDLSDAADITVGDLISRINASGLSLTASINATGDGIAVVDSSGGTGRFRIADTSDDTAAADLGLNADSVDATVNSTTVQRIDARQADTITVTATDSLQDIVDRINESSKFATASLVVNDDGTQGIAFRSARSGEVGKLSISTSGLDLGLRTTSTGKDAIVEIEQSDGARLQLKSIDGVFTDVVPGVSLTSKELSEEFVTVTVSRDTQTAVSNVKAFVTQYNKLVEKLDALTFYSNDSSSVGLLFGSSEALRVETGYTRLLSGSVFGAGSIRSIGELGLSFTDTGKLELNETKLGDKLSNDSEAVAEFMTKESTGLVARLSDVADRIAGVDNGLLISRTEALGERIQRNTAQAESMQVRLDKERDRLLKQYYAAEQSIAKLQNNQSYLSQIQYFGQPSKS